jgi:hypothetical protein
VWHLTKLTIRVRVGQRWVIPACSCSGQPRRPIIPPDHQGPGVFYRLAAKAAGPVAESVLHQIGLSSRGTSLGLLAVRTPRQGRNYGFSTRSAYGCSYNRESVHTPDGQTRMRCSAMVTDRCAGHEQGQTGRLDAESSSQDATLLTARFTCIGLHAGSVLRAHD